MAINFGAEYNKEIRRIVYNFNRKRKRAIKRGFSYLPPKQYVSELKGRYKTKAALDRELKSIEAFNLMGQTAFEVMETLGGGRVSRYQMDYMKSHLRSTKAFFDRRIKEAKELYEEDRNIIARREYLFNLEERRKYLDLDIDYLDESGIRTFQKYIEQAEDYELKKVRDYRNYLNIVDQVMEMVGFDKSKRDVFFAKLEKLTPAEFIKLYQRSVIIQRIYDLYVSSNQLSTDEEDATRVLTRLTDRIDEEIASINEK